MSPDNSLDFAATRILHTPMRVLPNPEKKAGAAEVIRRPLFDPARLGGTGKAGAGS